MCDLCQVLLYIWLQFLYLLVNHFSNENKDNNQNKYQRKLKMQITARCTFEQLDIKGKTNIKGTIGWNLHSFLEQHQNAYNIVQY